MANTFHQVGIPRAGAGPDSKAKPSTSRSHRSARCALDWIPASARNAVERVRAITLIGASALLIACATQPALAQESNPPPDKFVVDPAAAGWNVAALNDVLAYAQSQKTTGFLIIDHDRIIAERNWPLPAGAATFKTNFVHGVSSDGALLEDVASAQKSFVAILACVAIDKHLLDISKPVNFYLGAGWSKATPEQESVITVRNLMEMNSGLKDDFTYEAPAGTKFHYNTPAYAKMKPVLEKAAGQPLDKLTADWLTKPVGMKDSGWRQRPAAFADVGNPTGLVTSPRDMGRMGQMMLEGGKAADGTRVMSLEQERLMLTPTVTNPSYAHFWWMNGGAWSVGAGPNNPRSEGQMIKAAPDDLFAAQGAQDRKLYIVPSRQLIVVRLGQAAEAGFNEKLWQGLMKALPPK